MRERKFLLWKKNITLDYLEKLHDVYEDLVTWTRLILNCLSSDEEMNREKIVLI
jgi:hypothetical protein